MEQNNIGNPREVVREVDSGTVDTLTVSSESLSVAEYLEQLTALRNSFNTEFLLTTQLLEALSQLN